MMHQIEKAREIIENMKTRSAWERGVKVYAFELLESMEERAIYDDATPVTFAQRERWMLNGAADWSEYSWGGCSLIYDRQIAERLCNNTELKRTDYGRKNPNSREQWIDTQARALGQACAIVGRALEQAAHQ